MLTKNALIEIALALLLASANAADSAVTVVQADGEEVSGALKDINAEGATVDSRKFPAREIAQIKFATPLGSYTSSMATVILRNQDFIKQAAIVSGGDTKMTVKTSWHEALELEYKSVDAIVFYASGKKMPDTLASILKAASPKEDILLTLRGETNAGFFEKIDDKTITFNAGGQSKAYPLDQVAAIRLAATEKFEANKTLNASLQTADGSVMTVKPLGLDGDGMKVEALDGKTWHIRGTSIVSIEFSGGRMVFLSALTPKSVEQKPYIGGAPVVFTWRKDRSAANGPLKIGEVVYEKGVGVHSYCKLTYELNGEFVKFISDVGMDASAPPKAECAWKILVDGKEGAVGTAKSGGEKQTVKIDLAQAKVLELICDYGTDDDAGDRLDFAKARLIKP